LPVGSAYNPICPSNNEEGAGSGDPPKSFLGLVKPLCLSHDVTKHDIRCENGDKEKALTDNSELLTSIDAGYRSGIEQLFVGGFTEPACDHRTWQGKQGLVDTEVY
jgi:hypothetical protein